MSSCVYCYGQINSGAEKCPKCKAPNVSDLRSKNIYPYNTLKLRPSSMSRKGPSLLLVGFILFLAFGAIQQMFRPAHKALAPKTPAQLAKFIVQDEGIVPIFVGKNARTSLKVAESLSYLVSFSRLNKPDEYVDKSSTKFSESYVCYQSVLAGSPLVADLPISFVIDPSCLGAQPNMLAGDYGRKAGMWQPQTPQDEYILGNETVEGWMVGAGDQYSPQTVTVMTAYGEQTFVLSMIKPVTDWCDSGFLPDYLTAAAAVERDDLLPFGQRVQLVLAQGHGFNDVFINLLDSDGLPTSAYSVNEKLIRTGYWVPDGISISESDILQSPKSRKWVADTSLMESKLQAQYSLKLAKVANAVRSQKDTPVSICLSAEQKDWLTWH